MAVGHNITLDDEDPANEIPSQIEDEDTFYNLAIEHSVDDEPSEASGGEVTRNDVRAEAESQFFSDTGAVVVNR